MVSLCGRHNRYDLATLEAPHSCQFRDILSTYPVFRERYPGGIARQTWLIHLRFGDLDIQPVRGHNVFLIPRDVFDLLSTRYAAQAASQIAASAQQQMVGMDQVALAMENIKQATAQNAASTKQSEISARNLYALGQKLQGLVEQFTV